MVNYRILKIQRMIKELEIDAYIIPKEDEFFSTNVPEYNDRLYYVSGFDGSAGTLVVTESDYLFFTDSRYEIQAKLQLGITPVINAQIPKWLADNRKNITKIGYDAWLMKALDLEKFRSFFKMVDVGNLVDDMWQRDTHTGGCTVYDYDVCFTGEDKIDKMKRLAKALPSKIDAFIITDVDEISWLLNKRADVFKYLPAVPGFMVFYPKDVNYDLFFDKNEFLRHCQKLRNIGVYMPEISAKTAASLDGTISLRANPLHEFMVIKNAVEQESIIKIHEFEGAAICNFLAEIDDIDEIDEYQASNLLEEFRKKQPDYKGKSFETILGADANAAIVHYHPTEKVYKIIENFFLLDCGSQYWGGTTDMTRTVLRKRATSELIRDYTLVLKGHIALSSAVFPEGTTGAMLDTFARQYLWQHGLDYQHGTGHGVGNFLNVHEGDIRISRHGSLPLKEGVIISCEPGIYKENSHGIRIENLVLTQKHKNKGFLCFKTLTLVPYDKRLIDKTMLTAPEITWIDDYHQMVYKKLSGKVNNEIWLRNATSPL